MCWGITGRLSEDQHFRSLCGYGDRVPSRSVVRDTAATLARNWPRFQECALSPEASDELVDLVLRGYEDEGKNPFPSHENIFTPMLPELGWNGNLPPLYRPDFGGSCVPRRTGPTADEVLEVCSDVASAGEDEIVLIQGDVPKLSSKRIPRDWRKYNLAQGYEFADAKAVLGGLSDLINVLEDEIKGSPGKGRPRSPLGHVVFATVWKACLGLASRRLRSPLEEAVEQGYLRDISSPVSRDGGAAGVLPCSRSYPKPSTVWDYMKADWLTPLLLELVSVTAGPLREVDTIFAIDGTGLSTRNHERWLDVRPGNKLSDDDGSDAAAEADDGSDAAAEADDGSDAAAEVDDGSDAAVAEADDENQVKVQRLRNGWVKLHALSAVETHIIVRAAISRGTGSDVSFFKGLLSEAVARFNVRKVSADLAYSSKDNLVLADELGFQPLIKYKSNTRVPPRDGSPWSKYWHYQMEYPEEFLSDYHQRSNVESTFSAYKRLFPEHIRTRVFSAKVNEALCKTVAYNLSVLVRQVRIRRIDLDLPTEALALQDCVREVVEMRRSKSGSLDLAA